MATTTTEAESSPKKKSFFRKPLGCLLSLVIALALFGVLAVVFAIWFAGSDLALKGASKVVNDKSGATLTFGPNDTNLFAGRVHYKDIVLTNPGRWTDKRGATIKEVKAVVELGSLASDTKVVPELVLDIGEISLVGTADYIKDNNFLDIKKALAGEAAPDSGKQPDTKQPEPAPAESGKPQHFRIGKLSVRIGTIRVISNGETAAPKTVFDKNVGLDWELTDVSDENIKEKLYPFLKRDILPLGFASMDALLSIGADQATKLVGDLAGKGGDLAKDVADKTGKTINDTTKSITDGLGGLFGGKKDEKKDGK